MLRQFKYAEDILLGNTIATAGYQEQILSILKGKPFHLWLRLCASKNLNRIIAVTELEEENEGTTIEKFWEWNVFYFIPTRNPKI